MSLTLRQYRPLYETNLRQHKSYPTDHNNRDNFEGTKIQNKVKQGQLIFKKNHNSFVNVTNTHCNI